MGSGLISVALSYISYAPTQAACTNQSAQIISVAAFTLHHSLTTTCYRTATMADLGKKKSNNSLRTSNRIQSPSPIAIPTTAQAVVTKSGGGGDNLQRKKSHEILKSHQQKFNLHGKERGSGAVLHTPDVDLNGKNVRNGEREDGNEDEEEDNLVRKRIRVRRGMRRDVSIIALGLLLLNHIPVIRERPKQHKHARQLL